MTLLEELSNKDFLFEAWKQLKKENEDSHGLSGTTIKDFKEKLNKNISNISYVLGKGTYNFSPSRAAIIKKDNGKFRPLQIPEIQDRVVMKALAILLEDKLNDLLKGSEGISFAYQKGKGVREAVLRMKELFTEGKEVILKADIVNFFEEVKKDDLLAATIFPNLKDKTVDFLIEASLNQKLGGMNRLRYKYRKLFKNAGKGIAQGNPLSPLLSNLYLAEFDRHVCKLGFSMVRYADDFIVLFDTIENAKKGYEVISNYLRKEFSLNIHDLDMNSHGKTTIINPIETNFSFLSIRFDGVNLLPPSNSVGILKSLMAREVKRGGLNIDMYKEVYRTINKWISLYSYMDIERYFAGIDKYLLTILKKKFGPRNYNTKKCKLLLVQYRKLQVKKNTSGFWSKSRWKGLIPIFETEK